MLLCCHIRDPAHVQQTNDQVCALDAGRSSFVADCFVNALFSTPQSQLHLLLLLQVSLQSSSRALLKLEACKYFVGLTLASLDGHPVIGSCSC